MALQKRLCLQLIIQLAQLILVDAGLEPKRVWSYLEGLPRPRSRAKAETQRLINDLLERPPRPFHLLLEQSHYVVIERECSPHVDIMMQGNFLRQDASAGAGLARFVSPGRPAIMSQ